MDVISIFLSFIGGVLITSISFLFTYRSGWRNKLTREFTVKLKYDLKRVEGEKTIEITFKYDVDCSTSDELSINYIYFKLPKGIAGNYGPNPILDEVLDVYGRYYTKGGRFYINRVNKLFKYHLGGDFCINHPEILKQIDEKKMKQIQLVVNTSKYGDVKSNKEKLHPKRRITEVSPPQV